MEEIKALFTTGNLLDICAFIAKPLIILIKHSPKPPTLSADVGEWSQFTVRPSLY